MAWVSTAEAAVAIRRSPRTIERWCAAGRLQSRQSPTGREVWLDGDPPKAEQVAPDMTDTDDTGARHEAPDTTVNLPAVVEQVTTAAIRPVVADVLEVAQSARRWAAAAWITVAVLVIAGAVAVWAITDAAGRLRQAQDQAAEASRTATDRLTDMSGRLADVTERAQQAESRAVASATEARQSQERAVGLEQQLTEAQAAVEISLAKQQAAERERDAVRQLLNTRQVAAAEADDDVPGGGVAGQQ